MILRVRLYNRGTSALVSGYRGSWYSDYIEGHTAKVLLPLGHGLEPGESVVALLEPLVPDAWQPRRNDILLGKEGASERCRAIVLDIYMG